MKPRLIMCICTGECPGFKDLDLWRLVNYARNELDLEYVIVHPQLCVDDGDRFWSDYLRNDNRDVVYIVGGCDPRTQRKLFKEAFAEKGLDVERNLLPLDLRNLPTEEAMRKVEEAVEEAKKLMGKS
jgi:heterodisulfide reductase subunit A-like polyferredoxin